MTSLAGTLFAKLPAPVRRLVPSELQADLRDRFGQWLPGDIGFEPIPPAPVHGERTGPPDFIVLGRAESGARWWMSQIADHPDVAPSRSLDEAALAFSRYGTDSFGPDQIDRFHALFPRRPGRIIGHWSADGLSYPWVAPLLARAAPRAKVIVLVRDPVELLQDGLAATADTRPPDAGWNLADHVDLGFFGGQLTRVRGLFPSDQVRVLQYERCVSDTAGVLAQTFEFLGVDATERPVLPHPSGADQWASGERLDGATRSRLCAMYADDVGVLSHLVPDLDLGLWPNFSPPD
jgi:hypothetical protein